MAHLFLASKMAAPDDHSKTTMIPRMPTKSAMKQPPSSSSLRPPAAATSTSDRKDAVLTVIGEAGLGLAAATGGTEASCYRCTVPFGVVVLIAGAVVTAVAYGAGFNAHGSTISVLGLAMLSAGLALLAASALCWRLRGRRRRRRQQQQRDTRRESQTALIADA